MPVLLVEALRAYLGRDDGYQYLLEFDKKILTF